MRDFCVPQSRGSALAHLQQGTVVHDGQEVRTGPAGDGCEPAGHADKRLIVPVRNSTIQGQDHRSTPRVTWLPSASVGGKATRS
jgi:hypothetical protein